MRRLYVPYFLVLVGCMLLIAGAARMGMDVPLVAKYPQPRSVWIFGDFIAHAFMLHGVLPQFDVMGGNPNFWTLAREEYLYAFYPALLFLFWRLGSRRALLAVAAMGAILPVLFVPFLPSSSTSWTVVRTSAPVLWIQWALGMAAADAYCRQKSLPKFVTSPAYLPVWFAIGKVSELYLPTIPILKDAAYGLFFVALLNSLLSIEAGGKWPINRLVKWLSKVGVFSYSLYLVHQPIRMVLKPAIGRFISADTSLGFFVVAGVVTFAGYWGAVAYFHVVEKHFLNAPQKKADEVGQPALASRVVSGAA